MRPTTFSLRVFTALAVVCLMGILTASVNAAAIRQVQTGEVAFTTVSQTVTLPTALNNTANAILFFSERANSNASDQFLVRGNITNATTLTFVRNLAGASVAVRWYVAEFDSGVTVQRGTTTQATTITNQAVTAVNLAESFVLMSRERSGTGFSSDDFLRSRLTSTTNLEMSLNAGTGNTNNWQVVTFAGSLVQRNIVTLASASASTTVAIPTPIDTTRSFLLFSYSSGTGTAANIGQKLLRGWLSHGNEITFQRNNTGVAIAIAWEVVQLPVGNTVIEALSSQAAAVATSDITFSTVDTNRVVAFSGSQSLGGQSWGRSTYAADDNPGVASFTHRLLNKTTLRLERSFTTNAADAAAFVVKFSAPTQTGVVRVGNWTTGLTHAPGIGDNRLLVFSVGYENATDVGVSSVTFGGQAMTRIGGSVAGVGGATVARTDLWRLDEAGILAATNNNFVVTWGGTAPTEPKYGAATYRNVNQTSPVGNSSGAFTDAATPNPLTTTINVLAGGMSTSNIMCGNIGSYTWNNSYLEGFDQGTGSSTMSAADRSEASAGSSIASATHTGPNRQAIFAAALVPFGSSPNSAPVLAAIGPRNVNEGANLNFNISASDPDLTTPTLLAEDVPANATFNNNGNGTGTFNFNPSFSQAGVFNVRFIATDGSLADTEVVAITVANVNQAPVLAAIGPRNVNEGANLNFVATATDGDGTTPTLIAENVPTNATFVDNANGTGTFNFNPDFTQAGVFNVRFITSDGALADTELVTVTVNNTNRSPVLAGIGPQSVNEGVLLTFGTSASDPDATTPALTVENAPVGATYTDNANGTATFNFTPSFSQSGVYSNVRFIASDGALADTELVTITVNNVNRSPVLAAIGAQSVNEGVLLSFGTSATDPDATNPAMTVENAPAGATYTDNGNGTATFNFTPSFVQAGVFNNVRFIASDGSLADTELVTITVNNVSQAPVLASIGPRNVDENVNLNFGVSATDVDATTPTLSAENVPANATFFDNGNGTGTFDFTPNFTQAGAYIVRFIASDGALADTELVTVTVNNTNRAPALNVNGTYTGNEGEILSCNLTSSDPDATTPVLTAENAPANTSFTDNGNGTASFTFSPNFTQAGVYNVRFIASDGALADTEIVVFTVNNVNLAPVLAAIGAQNANEGQVLNVPVSASDPDATIPVLTAESTPLNATFTDNANGTGSFVFTPDFTQAGVYNVRFIASDGLLADTEIVVVTINNVNRPPVLAAIGAQSVNEAQNLTFGVSASDPDGGFPALVAENSPLNALFTDNGNGTGSFVFNPDFTQAGVYNVRFIASDGLLADSEIVVVTVNNVNRAPVLSAVGAQSVSEGVLLSFGTSATDPDVTFPALTAENAPVGATYTDNGNGTATFSFTPTFAQSAVYNVRFIASDGSLADTELVAITVNNVNQPPVLAAIGPKSVNEGILLTFGTTATDFDATPLTMTAENSPVGATYTDNGNGTATFNFTPTLNQSGVYPNIRFIVSDGSLSDTELVTITVNNVNQTPVLAAIGPKSVNESVLLTFGTSASDFDATPLTMTAENSPVGATYTDNGNGTATFNFTPTLSQSGLYNVRFIVSDGSLADTEVVVITVNNVNQAPVLATIGARSVNEGVLLTFGTSATDFDATPLTMTAENSPVGATYTDNGNGTATFDFTPTFAQSGVYFVRFIVSDGALADTEMVVVTVNNVNLAPVLAAIGAQSVNEGVLLSFGISATDADGTTPTLTAENSPLGAIFTDNANGTGSFSFTPDFTQAGLYNVRFIASDGALADTELVTITVNNVNRAPVLAAVGAQSVNEGVLLTFGTSATDPDATSPALTAENAPSGATYTDNGNGTATFSFTPSFAQAAVYNVRFIASDGSLADTEMVAITVNNVNQAPILAAIGSKSVNEGVLLSFATSATDVFDATPLTMTAENSPVGATYTDNGNGTATFNFTPSLSQSGLYTVRFIVSDGSLADTELVAITVNNVNQPPVLAAIGPKSVNEGVLLTFGTSATDFDATPLTMTAENSPVGATHTDNGNGTATFNFTPTLSQSGLYNVRFIVSDGSLADTEVVVITVNNVNQAPVLATIGARSVNEGVLLTFGTSATDFDATPLTMTAENSPVGATYTDNGNGTATFNFTPSFSQSGLYNVRFIVSDGSLADTELVAITVNNVNQPPVLAAIGPQSVNEGILLTFGTTASDFDATPLTMTAENTPVGATYTDNGNGTATFNFTPTLGQSGLYNVRFIVSDGSLADTELVAITVNNVNQAPILAAIGPKSVSEGVLLTFGTSASDFDATPLTMTAENSPVGATYTDNGNGTATFNFTPTLSQAGVYNVRFIVSDGSLADTELVVITVNNMNQAPILAAIGSKNANEGVLLSFATSATDVFDATPLTMTVENSPVGATYTDNGNGTATFNFTPTLSQSGVYNVRFIASDGSLADTELVTITVNNVNQAPVLAVIGPKSVNEGVLLSFATSATDVFDATPLTMTAESSPVGATYTDNGNGTATFNFTPTLSQSGVYNVRFIVSDGSLADTELVVITVNNVNQAPILAAIGSKSANEGVLLSFATSATDVFDATPLTMTAENSPVGATYTDNGNGTATFNFTPTLSQSGVYNVRFIVSDGSLADTELIVITVNNVNQAPVLAAIGAKSANEGVLLSFATSATDVFDATPLTMTAENSPVGATYTDNGNGTATFNFTPTISQSGLYNVRFIVSDGSLADTEMVAITVNNVNQVPVLAAIGAKSVNEGVLLTFGTTASDFDATPLTMTAENTPVGAIYTDNGNGTATFNFTPTLSQSGLYNVRFIVSDGSLADTEMVAITVNNVNQVPVLAAIGAKSVNEGVLLTFGTTASDFDATPLTMTAENTPIGATYTDNGNGTATFNFTPTLSQSGLYNVRFIVSDGSLADTELVTITVNNVNQVPVLATIGSRSVNEGVLLTFGTSASDFDATPLTMTAENSPVGATYTDNANGTGTFNFTPTLSQADNYNVRFIVSDGSLADTELVTITVNNVNQAPILAAIGPKSVNEGVLLTFATSATDVFDATPLTMTAENSPVGATYTDNGNGTATFNFTPTLSQSGNYSVRFIVSDGSLADTELVAITVNNVNQAPVLATIGPKSVNESVLLTFATSATDVFDATPLTMTAENSPVGATYTDNGNGTATFNFTPTLSQSGLYNVRFIVSDGSLADTELVAISVGNVNQAPSLAAIGPKSVNEGILLTFGTSASDFDATPLTMTAENSPVGATYADNGNGTATFNFTPSFTQSGLYNVRFIVSDGSLADTEIVTITVNNVNRSPVLATIGPKSVNEGLNLNFAVSGSDLDLTPLTLAAESVPLNAAFTDNGNGTGSFDFNPSFVQAGVYNVRFIVSDGSLADTELVTITVNNVNRAPVLATIGPRIVNEGQNLNFGTSAVDPDGSVSVMTALNVPLNASYTDHGNGTATFNFNPNFTQSGIYSVTFIASDGVLADTELVSVTVTQVNLAPVLVAIGAKSVTEGQALNFAASATDADATTPVLSAENVPTNATFVDNGNGTGSFTFNPNFIQAGVYSVRFIASDGVLADSEVVAITVNEAGNQSPVLAPIGAKSVTEGNLLSFRLSGTDAEFAALTFFTSILPAGAVFVDSGNGAASLTWTPGYTQSGTYFVTFAVQDPPGAVDNELVRIDVLEAGNQRPVLAAIGPRNVQEGANLNFIASATDLDATTPTLSAVNLPANATFVNNGNGTGTFNFNAAFGQAGVYNVTFIASDGLLADSELVAITVGNVNERPILASIGPRSVNESVNLNFGISATDPDLTIPTLVAQDVPVNATFIDNGNGTGTFDFNPDFTQAGIFSVRFFASDGTLADTEIVAITVNNVNRAPVLTAIGAKSVNEGVLLTFGTSATDPDATNPAMTAENAPAGATYTDNGNGTASFSFTPTFSQAGVYNVRFIASDGGLADTEIVVVTVNNVNLAPVLATIGPRTVNEGVLLSFSSSATDPDGTFPALTAENTPTGAVYTDNGNGTASFSFTPNFTQSGIYNVRFIASDGALADTEIVVLTVTESNLPPVLAAIGPKSVNEGVLLNFGVSASDPDASTPSLVAQSAPSGASFTDNGNGTGSFNFTPTFAQSGVYNVRFIASDGALADTEIVVITVNNVNLAPVLATIGAKSVNEGVLLTFSTSATDFDATPLTMIAQSTPVGATYTDNGNGTATFSFTPSFSQSGLYNVRFIVSDGSLADTEIVAITVNNVNQAPVLATIGAKSVNEGVLLTFGTSATDFDATPLTMIAQSTPVGVTYTDNGNGTATFSFTPSFSQSGLYNVRFIVSDGSLADTEIVAITVNDVNQAPILAAIGAKTGTEGVLLTFGTSASDVDATPLTMTAQNTPPGSTYTDNGNGTATFNFTPTFVQAGVYPNVRFIVSDGSLADTELVTITINESGNQAPVLATIGPRSVTEGFVLNFNISAADPDATTPSFVAQTVPTNATFVDNGNGTGTFNFAPSFVQAGVYNVRFIASDGSLTDTELVMITVNEAGNQAPVLAAIGPRIVSEGQNLNFNISATDPDATIPTFVAQNTPANSTFLDNGNGTGTFNFNPDFTQAGVYNVTFIASDGALADSEVVTITVNTAGNQRPVLAAIGPRSVDENQLLSFGVSAVDPDATIPVLFAQLLPSGSLFDDNSDGTGSFDWTPTFAQSGVYNVRFIATDGLLADTELVAITVNNVNRPPVLATIGAKSVNEGVLLSFATSATDADATPLTMSAENTPVGSTYTDNGNGTASFSFTPTFSQSGLYNVRFIVSDGSLADTELVAITVNNANQAPVLAAIGPKAVNEGVLLSFGTTATDFDASPLTMTAESSPAGATYTDNGNGTASFNFTPTFSQSGVYNIRFIVSDGALADTEIVVLTVNNVNQAPVLAAIGSKIGTEGVPLTFGTSATDVDATPLTMTAQSTPGGATYIDNGNGTATFNFTPTFVQAGIYNVRFIVSDGVLADSELVVVTINESGNQAPVLASIGPRSVTEGLVLNFNISATDPDATTPSFVAQSVPTNATFIDNGNGSGTFNFAPSFTQAGVFNVRFIASDGSLTDTELVAITVIEAGNQRPVLATIGPRAVTEGLNLNFNISATDPDATTPTFVAQNTPANSTFLDNGNGTGTFNFNPDFTQAGIYSVRFIATDGVLADTEVVAITVNGAGNQRPVLAPIGARSTNENQNLNFDITATDADATTPTLIAQLVPSGATFTNNGDGTGTFDWTPSFTQAGVYNVRFIATDGSLTDTEMVAITVNNVNRAPVLAAIGPRSVNEGATLNVGVTASDPDANIPTLAAQNVPTNATFTDNGNGTGSFVFNPDFTQAGAYNVLFITSDGTLADSELVAITVNNTNRSPILAAIGPKSVAEGANLNFGTSATDPDLSPLTMTAVNVPVNATYTDNGNGTGTFNFNPDFTQAGAFSVTIVASDGSLADSEVVAITVSGTNLAPVLATIGARSVTEGQNLNFITSATDPDATIPSLVAQNVPANATFVDNGNGTGTFNFNPNFVQTGIYNVRFIASDGSLSDTELVAITVNEAGNQAPVLAGIGPRSVTEGLVLNFNVSATDPDATTPSFVAQNVPTNATFTDNGNGTGTFTFAPNFVQAGVYSVRFIASDGSLTDTELVAITVGEAGNQRPVLATIGPRSVNEGVNLNFSISANDADSTIPALLAQSTPTNSSFIDNGNGTGTFNFNPDFTQAGVYNVRFITTDGSLADTEIVVITVNGAGNQRPVLAPIGARSTNENQNLNFDITATDADATTPTLIAQLVPSGATFTNNGDGTGTFDWTPSFAQSGLYNVRFIATDGSLADTELVAITVTNVNRAPVLTAIGPRAVNEGVLLTFGTSASDPDATPLTMTAESTPVGATYIDNGNGTATFSFTPTLTQSGVYNVRFITSDGTLADSELVTITVSNVNQAPVLAAIGPKSVNEGVLLTFGTSASDFDATPLTMTAESTPVGAIYTDNGNGTATFNFTPTFAQSGVYNVRFIASDGALADTETVVLTVNNVNQAPVLAAIGPRSGTEGALLTFGTSAADFDATPLTMTAQSVPVGATYTDNGNGTATFNFTPSFVQAGIYNVRFIVSDGALADSELVIVTISESGNQAPVLAAIGPRSVTEGLVLNFNVSGTDPDATIPSFVAESVPTNATFVDNGNGTGTFNFAPNFVQAGPFNVRFIATDGSLSDTEVVAITVIEAGNQRPVLASIGPRSVTEGQNLNFGVSANDADSTVPALLAQITPPNAAFIDNGNGTGTFNFNPDFTQAGIYNVRFIASDGTLADTEIVVITVNSAGNQRPVLSTIGARSVNENANLNFDASATDADATTPTLIAQLLPPGATFSNNGDGTGTFDWTPSFTQAGVFNVRFIATDGSLADTEIVAITVSNVNRAPILTNIGPRSVNEGQVLNIAISATDPDANIPTLAAENVPTNASFVDNANGTGSFTFSPNFTQSGVYNVRFITSDGSLADTELVTITVNHVSLTPVLAPIGAQSVNEGQTLNVNLSASDFDATIPTLIAELVPVNAIFTDNGNGTGLFTFTPDFTQGGTVYNVRFIASDGALADTEVVAITVNNVNRVPVLATIGPRSVNENANLNFGVTGSDPDGTTPTLVAQLVPINGTFIDNGNGTGTFNFNPAFTQAGVYNVRFIASDGLLSDTEMVAITVNDVNAPPVLASIGAKSVAEAANLNFNISATDIDATFPILNAVGVPANASFVNNGNGTGTFNFSPDFTQSGIYNVTFVASDGALADSEVVQITVSENNRQPVANAGVDQGPVAIGFVVTLDGSGSSDLDGDSLGFHWRQVAGPAVLVGDSTLALASFTPPVAGTYRFRLIVDDAQIVSLPDTVQVTAVSKPSRSTDLMASVTGNSIQLSWSAITTDTSGSATSLSRYVVYRGTRAYFAPTFAESIGVAVPAAVSFTDNNLSGADVVGDTGTNYFYCLEAVDAGGGRSEFSNRVGEYDYQVYTTSSTDFSFIMMPFANTGITTASDLIQSIGAANVNTVNRFIPASQSYEARFAAGFGPNFAVVPGGIYQVNAKTPLVWSIAGRIPDSGTISYPIVLTSTTDFSFIGIPFERELEYSVAQNVIDAIPGVLNTLNRFIPSSQSYESRFYAGFGPNFPVKAGRVYQANARAIGAFPAP